MITLSMIFTVILIIEGLWVLFFTGDFLNTRQTRPTVLMLARVLFILCVVLLILTHIGAIKNSIN